MPTRKLWKTLRRYTSLPSLLHILQNKQITLLSPALWDDRNDAFYLSQYKQKKKLKTVLALCFAETPETYHHWRVFTQGAEGVCISFKRAELIAGFEDVEGVRLQAVKYKKIDELKTLEPKVRELPFLKREPYGDEKEFRLVYESKDEEVEAKAFDIDLTAIDRITLNPWLAKPLAGVVKKAIKSIASCRDVKVYQTTLLENENWKQAAIRAAR